MNTKKTSNQNVNLKNSKVDTIHQTINNYYSDEVIANARNSLIKAVKCAWIDGVLKKSLHNNEVLIHLNSKECNELISNLTNYNTDEFNDDDIDENSKIIDIFHKAGGNLLILGEAGSGKTTSVLKLADSLLIQAENKKSDEVKPIPIVFNLSSWQEGLTIDDWVLERLKEEYNEINRDILNHLIINKHFIFIFDALDEVKEEYRDKCLLALNKFYCTKVVSCRIKDYKKLQTRLKNNNANCTKLKSSKAIIIKPLTIPQIDNYLMQVMQTNKFNNLNVVLERLEKEKLLADNEENRPLYTLFKTPFMLFVATSVYKDKHIQPLLKTGTVEEHKQHIFNQYIKKALLRRKSNNKYLPKQALKYLRNIAKGLEKGSQTQLIPEIVYHQLLD